MHIVQCDETSEFIILDHQSELLYRDVKLERKIQQKPSSGSRGDSSGPSVDLSADHWSLIRNGLSGRVALKKEGEQRERAGVS